MADASVVSAAAFDESCADEAEAMLEGGQLVAPPLLAYELASVARKKAQNHPDQIKAIETALDRALQLRIQWVEVGQLAAFRLANATGLTTYDASYLYVARSMGIELVTFDRRLRAAAAANG